MFNCVQQAEGDNGAEEEESDKSKSEVNDEDEDDDESGGEVSFCSASNL